MIRERLLLLWTLLSLAAGLGAPVRDGLDDASKSLRDAIVKEDAAAQKAAVEQIVASGDARGLAAFHDALMDVLPQLRKFDAELVNLESDFERRKDNLDRERAAAGKDESKLAAVRRSELGFKEWVDKTLTPARKRVNGLKESRDFVAKGSVELTGKLAPDKRRGEVDRLAKLLTNAERGWEERVAAMECFAFVGDPQAFASIWKVGGDARKERKKLLTDLPKKEEEFEKAHERFYKEAEKNGNKYTPSMKDLLDKAKNAVTELQEKVYAQTQLLEAAVRLTPESVNSLPAAAQAKAVSDLVAVAKGNDGSARLCAVEALGGVRDPSAKTVLRSLLTGNDPGTRVAALDALSRQRDEAAVDAILEKCVKDEEWSVRAAALRALTEIRSAKAIPGLIAAYESEVGRLRDDALDALQGLTGLTMSTPAAWKQWWEKSQSGFTPPTSRPSKQRGPRSGETGVAFVGIQSSSKNVAFVVDVSGSMNFGLQSEAAPNEGEPTRFALLKRELEAAIEKMPEGGKFSIVTFSTSANRWNAQALAVNPASKQKALEFVRKEMVANGGTNIYAALKEGFDIAGMGATDKYYRPAIDTIYFLTDGKPSPDTEMTDPERLLAYVRERNKLAKIAVHVICLGEADAAFLKKLAEQNNGEFAKP